MKKTEFLEELRTALAGLSDGDIEERISFYGEMIDDRMEEGAEEEEAVASLGGVESVRDQIIADMPLSKLVKEKIKPKRRLRTREIVLIVLGSPLWFPLLVAAIAVLLSLYVVLWSLVISLWAAEISLFAAALGALAISAIYFSLERIPQGIMLLGGGLFIAGLSIFMFFACLGASKGTVKLTKKIVLKIKAGFAGKENAK